MRTFQKARKLQLATLAEGALIGRVDDFQFDLESGQIFGWRVKGQGVFAKTGGLPASALVLLGRDLALADGEGAVTWSSTSRGDAEGRAWAGAYLGTQVVTRRGAELGKVEDYVVETDPPRVLALLVDGARVVPFGPRATLGKGAVIVDDPTAARGLPSDAVETPAWWEAVEELIRGREVVSP